MKWISHKIVTVTTTALITTNICFILCSMFGSIFPDLIEGKPWINYKNWRKRHRTVSHWLPLYLILFIPPVLTFYYFDINITKINNLQIFFFLKNTKTFLLFCTFLFVFFVFGCICHILEDALCGKIPAGLLPNKRKFGIKIFEVGTFSEFLFVFSVVLCLCILILIKERDLWIGILKQFG